jgi:hypothetical protein
MITPPNEEKKEDDDKNPADDLELETSE